MGSKRSEKFALTKGKTEKKNQVEVSNQMLVSLWRKKLLILGLHHQ